MPTGIHPDFNPDKSPHRGPNREEQPYWEWHLDFCNVKEAWELEPKQHEPEFVGKQKGEGIAVIHPDTGYTKHPELVGDRYLTTKNESRSFFRDLNFLPGIVPDATIDLSSAEDQLTKFGGLFPSHGTGAASVLMSGEGHPNKDPQHPAHPNNPSMNPPPFPGYIEERNFVTGFAPKVTVIPMKVSRSVLLWDVDEAALARSIYAAISLSQGGRNVGVISISLGTPFDGGKGSKALRNALEMAKREGIVVCAAAGQFLELCGILDFFIDPIYPGSDSNTICVAACDHQHGKFLKGFHGKAVDITAPGVKIWRARAEKNSGKTRYFVAKGDGTSYSAPMVAAACAMWQAHHNRAYLIKTYGKNLIFDLFKKVLQESCDTTVTTVTTTDPISNGTTTSESTSIKVRTANGTTTKLWDTEELGAGVLDVKRLLERKLPTKAELENHIRER